MEKSYAEKFIGSVEVKELDMEYPFYTKSDQEEPSEVMISSNVVKNDVPSMDIDNALEIIEKLKNDGANRIYFINDVDTKGYTFSGVKLIEL